MSQAFSKIWIPITFFVFLFIPTFVEGNGGVGEALYYVGPALGSWHSNVLARLESIDAFFRMVRIFSIVITIIFHAYLALCLMFLAKKTQTPKRWMAWIPVLNFLLLCRIAKKPDRWIVSLLLPIILSSHYLIFEYYPINALRVFLISFLTQTLAWEVFLSLPIIANLAIFYDIFRVITLESIPSLIQIVTGLVFIIMATVLWMVVAKIKQRPAWWGILMLIPIVNFVIMGILAFSDKDKLKPENSKQSR